MKHPPVWRVVSQELRLLAGHWRKPTRDVPAFPILRVAIPLLLVGVLVVLAGFKLDENVARGSRELPRGLVAVFRATTDLGTSGWMFATAALVGIGALALRQRRGGDLTERAGLMLLAQRALYVIAALAVTGIATQVLKQLIGRARPGLIDQFGPFHFDALELRSSLASFPSGHSSVSFAIALALGYFLPRWRVPLLGFAVFVAMSRLIVGAHYPSDVIAGAYVGVAATIIVTRAFARRGIAFVWRDGRLQARGRGLVGDALRAVRGSSGKGTA